MVSACWVSAQNGLYQLDLAKLQCAAFATVFVLGLPSGKLQEGTCICDGSLSYPTE